MNYRIENSPKPAITSTGRINRKESYQLVIAIPQETKEQLDAIIEGGTIGGAVSGLILFALDTIIQEKKKLIIQCVSVYGFLDTFFVHQAATFTASFWMARTAAGVL